ncbi:ATP-binding protein [Pseudobutyrivibrio ruminis]|uniref:PD-(D/E)XK nuclease superfamily protein n=1 Tax=Pseudobutyrivibrio ruminis DSM 9787 TaxID=1123011 RepID=A0A285S8V1_9FIRM|nr:ATP-binding protein [Pseudobutyrivibrio ruminis]SOC04013.1 PD-(D/E)XK nuclease superfamily protein [Pseudobutyrivibrio ruminis DSM 9787]
MRKLPIGIQGFEKLITEDFVYVDKTDYIYQLVHNNVPYFLSRPRRFGKSLLLSTLKAYWEGKKELFSGLKIEQLEAKNPDAWKKYPVFYFDFNGANYQVKGGLEDSLNAHLKRWEKEYGNEDEEASLPERFQNLLINVYEKEKIRSVVLIDEYDKPLLDVVDNDELQNHNKEVFKAFFSTLKSCDEYIHFIFITGVSKFHKVSIFSDLNQLNDISLSQDFSGICGITKEEIEEYFYEEVKQLSERQELTVEDCMDILKKQYDGYHFHPEGVGVYNPFSLLKSFFDKDFGAYWFETGTPTFLVNKLVASNFEYSKLTNHKLYASESVLKDYSGDNLDAVPLLYQTGYLTIVDYDRKAREYTLAFPNDEVKNGFLESLLPEYVTDIGAGSNKDIFTLRRYVEDGDLEQIKNVLIALFASIPYTKESDPFEYYFQSVIYIVFTLLGKFTVCEMHTFSGRIDCKVETSKYIYLFEFKRDESAEDAIAQINSKEYALPFKADKRKLYKIGVSFDSKTRKLAGWQVEE